MVISCSSTLTFAALHPPRPLQRVNIIQSLHCPELPIDANLTLNPFVLSPQLAQVCPT